MKKALPRVPCGAIVRALAFGRANGRFRYWGDGAFNSAHVRRGNPTVTLPWRTERLTAGINSDTMTNVASAEKILERMRAEPASIRFADLQKVCEAWFGAPRQSSGSHVIFKTPWPGDPRVNIQNDRGKAKVYQVRQVVAAIDKMLLEQR